MRLRSALAIHATGNTRRWLGPRDCAERRTRGKDPWGCNAMTTRHPRHPAVSSLRMCFTDGVTMATNCARAGITEDVVRIGYLPITMAVCEQTPCLQVKLRIKRSAQYHPRQRRGPRRSTMTSRHSVSKNLERAGLRGTAGGAVGMFCGCASLAGRDVRLGDAVCHRLLQKV